MVFRIARTKGSYTFKQHYKQVAKTCLCPSMREEPIRFHSKHRHRHRRPIANLTKYKRCRCRCIVSRRSRRGSDRLQPTILIGLPLHLPADVRYQSASDHPSWYLSVCHSPQLRPRYSPFVLWPFPLLSPNRCVCRGMHRSAPQSRSRSRSRFRDRGRYRCWRR
jgi:hypothetical protein